MASRKVTLRFGLSTAFAGVIGITVFLMGAGVWLGTTRMIRSSLEDRLRETVAFGLTMIPAEEHAKLRTTSDERSAHHLRLVEACRKMKAINPDIRYVYSLRQTDAGDIVFVLDSEFGDEGQEYTPIGEAYPEASEEMHAYFRDPAEVRVLGTLYTDRWGTWLTGLGPIETADGHVDGVLGVDISVERMAYYQRQQFLYFSGFLAVVLLSTTLFGSWIARRVSRPILQITGEMQKIRRLELGESQDITSRIVEVNEMGLALENMKKGLRSFRKFVPADVVNELIRTDREATLGSEKKEISVFFSDIKDFTAISEAHDPERLAELLGVYFEGMTRTLHAHSATVDKYIGDAVMAFWGAPKPVEQHAVQACRAALECLRYLEEHRREWVRDGKPPFHTRIGISTGEAVVGNMGYDERMSYTALGDIVNLASRLEALNKYYGTGVIVSASTYEVAREHFVFRFLDVVAVKGKSKGVRIYELVGERGALDAEHASWVEAFNAAMELYLARRWSESGQRFAELSAQRPGDAVASLLVKRVAQFQATPPDETWSGVVFMREK